MRYGWVFNFQLVPPDMHIQNAVERAILIFKSHFLAILTSVAPCFPCHLWDLLLTHTEMTLNLLWQATSNPAISAWEYLNGKFNYNTTPLGTLGISFIFHTKTGQRQSWDFRCKDGWSVVVSIAHYRCQHVIPKITRSMMISYTTEFRHHHITQPSVTPKDRVLHGLQRLTAVLQGAPSSQSGDQIRALQYLQDTINDWAVDTTPKDLTAPQHIEKDK